MQETNQTNTPSKVPPNTRSRMEGIYKPPEAPPMRDGADVAMTLKSRVGNDLLAHRPPVSMAVTVRQPANTTSALIKPKQPTTAPDNSKHWTRKQIDMKQPEVKPMTKKQTTQATAPATTTAPPGVVSVGKGTIQKRINPGLYAAWLKQRGPGDVLDVEPSKFDSVKGHLSRYAKAHGLNWRITGQVKGENGLCRIGIEARE